MTVLEGYGYSRLPCAQVLSVAGFFDILSLFTLGGGVYSEKKDLPDYPRFLIFLTVFDVIRRPFIGAQESTM